MKDPITIIGMGQMGMVFASGFLRAGHPVYPVVRGMDLRDAAAAFPEPALVLVAVAEQDLHPVLEALPYDWRGRLALLQNELLPRDWERHGIAEPTVIAVWFEKKKGQDVKVILPSPVFGSRSSLIEEALLALGIPALSLSGHEDMLFELVRKNLYILTTNIAGLRAGGTVGELWKEHQDLANAVAADVLDLQESLTGKKIDRDALVSGMVMAFEADPDHLCTGRSAPERLARAIGRADEEGLAVPALRAIAAENIHGT